MPFKFRLDKVLMLRKDELDNAQQAFVESVRQVEIAKNKLIEKKEELAQAHDDMIRDNYKMAQEYLRMIRSLDKAVKRREIELKQAEQNVIIKRQELLEAQMRLEALEKLKEKQAEEYHLEENRLEQIETNERVSLKFASELMERQRVERDGED